MKIITVVGARPNFMKAAPLIAAIKRHNREAPQSSADLMLPRVHHVLVHTGQHYDSVMSDSFFADLNLPAPDIQLGVGSGSHAAQTGEVLRKFEEVLLQEQPDVVVVVGDVNSTVACALATAKISFDSSGRRPLLAHVEAGLRSFDRTMPEEVNRVVTDHISDLLFVTEESGLKNLHCEGLSGDSICFVGNTMIDSLLAMRDKADKSTVLNRLGLRASGEQSPADVVPYAVLTLHRPSNVDNQATFMEILGGLEELAATCPIVFPVHPRTHRQINEFGVGSSLKIFAADSPDTNGTESRPSNGVIMTGPMGYLDFVCLMKHACLVVTDSGGIQEETTGLGIPCVTVRSTTERPITIESGTNVLAGIYKEGIREAIRAQRAIEPRNRIPEKWDGHAAERILAVLLSRVAATRQHQGAPVELSV